MGDAPSGLSSRAGYFQQYLARMAPTPLPPPPLPFPASSPKPLLPRPRSSGRRAVSNDTGNKGKPRSSPPRKSLVDAFKQHGMKLCDGSKLNAVSKGVTHLGAIPPTLGVHITALYLSQNELAKLDGVEQFQNVRLLSLAANRLARFPDIDRLAALPQLRHLNLVGNPLCDYPHYRSRVIAALRQLVVLDTIEITKQEREVAPIVASQDRALCDMVMKNHMEIQKLQRLVAWICVVGELQCGVVRDAVTGRFDQLPSAQGDGVFNTDRFLCMWRYEDSLEARERETLETQMLVIVTRTRTKLTEETSQIKAKEMLIKLANVSVTRRRHLNEWPAAMRREHGVWEDAYAHILQLQQQTIATLRSECARNRQATLENMRALIVVNPAQRFAGSRHRPGAFHSQQVVRSLNRDAATETNDSEDVTQRMSIRPEDLDLIDPAVSSRGQPVQPMLPATNPQLTPARDGTQPARPNQLTLRRVLRSGQFGNKCLQEAIQSFSLRQPAVPKPRSERHHIRTKSISIQAQASSVSRTLENDKITEVYSAAGQARAVISAGESNPSSHWTHARERDSCRTARSETVCSADTQYAPSIGDVSSEYNSDSDVITSAPVVVMSRVQHSRLQDEFVRHHEAHPHELKTVYEDDPSCNTVESAVEDGDEHGRDQTSFSARRPRFLNERQHELEAREEKYITALMESEQRELDLRQQMSVMDTQLARFQQQLLENDDARQRFKHEIQERTAAVARPRLLRRCFIKWIHHYQWSLQVSHLQRKRQLVVQHDAFWSWRRQVWAEEQLGRIRTRQQTRAMRRHLIGWANLTRISVIAHHTQALRQSQLMKRVLTEWRQQVHVKKLMGNMIASRIQIGSRPRLATAFGVWTRAVMRARQMQRLHLYYVRDAAKAVKQSVMIKWKVYVLTVARPQRINVDAFKASRICNSQTAHFKVWKRLVRAERLHGLQLRRKVWRAWWSSIRLRTTERERVISYRSEVLKLTFSEWRRVAADQAASRRSLNLAMRHVNHRRLRKLWMYWKIYSIAHKRYMQGAIKARKHFYRKLIRRTWARWKRDTRDHLVAMKQTKHGILGYHFSAFCEGVRRRLQAKKRQVSITHAAKRRFFAQVRRTFVAWARCTKRRRRCHTLYQFMGGNRRRAMMSGVWSRWRHMRMIRLQHKLLAFMQHNQIKANKNKDAKRDLAMLTERSVSLENQVCQLTSLSRDQAKEIRRYHDKLQQREIQFEELGKELDDVMRRLLQADDDRQDTHKRAQLDQQDQESRCRQLEEENDALKEKTSVLEGTVETLSHSLADSKSETSLLQTRLVEAQDQANDERHIADDREQSLRETIRCLEKCLQEEHAERDETVQRLQEYEARIVTTCAEISDHENAHEQKCLKLRAENTRLEMLHNEATVRSTELERLLSEKNEQIIALSVRLKDAQWKDERIAQLHRRPAGPEDPALPSEIGSLGQDCNAAKAPDGAADSGVANSILCFPVKSVQSCVLVTTEENCTGSRAATTKDTKDTKDLEPTTSISTIPSEEERLIDQRTSQIHADLQLLQERITKRLQQVPCVPSVDQLTRLHSCNTNKLVSDSDVGSVSTLSESEQDRKTIRRKVSTAVRTKTIRTTGALQPKAGGRTMADRENSSRLANRSAARVDAQLYQPKPPTHRPLGLKTEINKVKKRSNGRAVIKRPSILD